MTLVVDDISCYYGQAKILSNISLKLEKGEVLGILGRNGAGKTTLLRTVMGLLRPRKGRIIVDGIDISREDPYRIPKHGLAYVPQGRRLFTHLTVEENLKMGLLVGRREEVLQEVFQLFPTLQKRLKQKAGTLSGGEQQMLAIARAFCCNPKYLLMDEPLEGLMPALISKVIEIIKILKNKGIGVLLVEQKIEVAYRVADRVILLENGTIAKELSQNELKGQIDVIHRVLGVRRY